MLRTPRHMHTHTNTHMFKQTHINMYTYRHTNIHMDTHFHTYFDPRPSHARTHTHTHAHTHTHTVIFPWLQHPSEMLENQYFYTHYCVTQLLRASNELKASSLRELCSQVSDVWML